MTPGVTAISREVYDLHMLIFWICVAIGAVVFGVMFWSIYHHRKSRGAVAAQFHESALVEVLWTIVPMLILVAMAVPATKTLIRMADARGADLTIKVTGYQWRWHYEYLNEGIDFFSTLATPQDQIHNTVPKDATYLLEVDRRLVVPVGKKIRILTTAADVIHSWWVPALGWKRDAIPGFINESWTLIEKPGVYRGQCAELCGQDHGFMPVVVDAVPEAEFQQWVANMKAKNLPAAQAANGGQPL
ncbi:MAG: cytochrome c oxidase subunit II [Candidatus Contendobacter sp.]|nr:MAG: cytochrome c oxidase subunit II [Candidatus Contendobacter sp.]